jgi:phage anti-repressor protein
VVYGTELFEKIESKRQFTDWIKIRFSECEAVEGEDYQSFSQKNENHREDGRV